MKQLILTILLFSFVGINQLQPRRHCVKRQGRSYGNVEIGLHQEFCK